MPLNSTLLAKQSAKWPVNTHITNCVPHHRSKFKCLALTQIFIKIKKQSNRISITNIKSAIVNFLSKFKNTCKHTVKLHSCGHYKLDYCYY